MKTTLTKNYTIKTSLLLILFLTALNAQEPSANKEPSANEKPSIQTNLVNLKGTVVTSSGGKKIAGVFVTIADTDLFALTEKDGVFLIEEVPVGEVTLTFEVQGFEIKEQNITVPLEGLSATFQLVKSIQKKKSVKKLSGQRVRKTRTRSSDAALLARKRNSFVVQDAIGSEQIAKSGDSDAGAAAKRVTGTSLVGNNIFIRGMGERYVSVLLENSLISSPDPDKKIVPLDIFPTSLIDSLTVQKTYSPDQPGEFGSGSINIELKDYPEKRFFKVGLSLGFEFDTIGKKYFSYGGGAFDFLGYDDGTRALPSIGDKRLEFSSRNGDIDDLTTQSRKFNRNFTVNSNLDAFPNYGFSFTYGDSFDLKKKEKLGYLFSLSHQGSVDSLSRNDTLYDKNLIVAKQYEINRSVRESDLNAFFTMSYLPVLSQKFKLTSFYSHKSTDRAQIEIGQTVLDQFRYREDTFEFVQNDLIYLQLSGSHLNKKLNDSLLKWSAAYSFAIHYNPDSHSAEYDDSQGDWRITDPTLIQREYLENNEHSVHAKVEYAQPFKIWLEQIAKGYLGIGVLYKDRLVRERNFQYVTSGNATNDIFAADEPLENILVEENIIGYSVSEDGRVYIIENDNDSYQGDIFILNTFLKIDLPILSWIKISGGLNYEYSKLSIYDYNVWEAMKSPTPIRDDVLTEHNFLPAANIVILPTKNLNLRLSYSKSIARPDFREAIAIQYNLNEGGQSVFGNIDLVQSDIHSADFRIEFYPWKNDLISLSAFYKFIENPIEILQLAPANPDEIKYKYQNGDRAENYGFELEVRKIFERKKSLKKNMQMIETSTISANFSYIISEITVSDKPGAIYSQRDRPLQGQSPYVFNLLLSQGYDFKRKDKLIYGFEVSTVFNLVGPRIQRVALRADDGGSVPDVYEEPAPNLNIVFKNRFAFGEIDLVFKNVLDLPDRLVQGENEINSFREGREFSIKFSTTF